MNDTVRMLQYSADLVKAWGQAQLPSGKTLAEMLSLQGFPLWEAMAVDIARLHVPKALKMGRQPAWFAQEVRPYLSWAKHTALNRIRNRRTSQACAAWVPKPTFLFLGFSDYMYRDVLQPISVRLAECKEVSTVSLQGQQRVQSIKSRAEQDGFQSIWQHWDGEVDAQVRSLRKGLQAAELELQGTGVLPRVIQDQDRPLWPQMKDMFNWLFRVYLPLLLPQVVIARHILERHQPALVISPDVADPRTRLYCLLARQVGIPSLEIQFGAFGEDSIEWQFFVADRLAVWGDQAYEVMLAHGVPAGRITITGSPRHDCLINITDTDVTRIRARIGIPEGSVMVLFSSVYEEGGSEVFSNPENPNLISLMKKAVFQAADQADGLCLVVKPHPLENARKTRQLAGKMRNIQFTDPRADIRELTKACDVFVAVTGSTTVTDALIANKLTIIPVFPGWIWSDQFVKSGAILVPRSAEEVAHCLQMVVEKDYRARIQTELEPARQRFLRQWVGQADGQASARIEALVRQMAKYS